MVLILPSGSTSDYSSSSWCPVIHTKKKGVPIRFSAWNNRNLESLPSLEKYVPVRTEINGVHNFNHFLLHVVHVVCYRCSQMNERKHSKIFIFNTINGY
ncbi:hypothetical protein M0804_010153 [Polistes exclamans]|nr:hypothetical protein M0804_010153 [Polistes exclamans]